jgi:hypothetical protein
MLTYDTEHCTTFLIIWVVFPLLYAHAVLWLVILHHGRWSLWLCCKGLIIKSHFLAASINFYIRFSRWSCMKYTLICHITPPPPRQNLADAFVKLSFCQWVSSLKSMRFDADSGNEASNCFQSLSNQTQFSEFPEWIRIINAWFLKCIILCNWRYCGSMSHIISK